MSLGLKPYSAYRDSGVEWMGQVPHGWQTSKVKRLAREGHKTFVDGDWIESPYIASEGIRLIQTGNIGVGVYREQGFRYISEDTFTAFGCTEFRPNDVLICRLGEPVSRACLAPDLGVRMITSVDVCILKPREDALAAYIVYAMSSSRYLDWVNSLVRGSTRDRVSRSMLGSFVLPLPPLDEQRFIVRYLDYSDRRIRSHIRAKLKLIKLLEEQKQATIQHAVTGQIDVRTGEPYPAYKDSGVEWAGKVPEHWEVRRLRYITDMRVSNVDKLTSEHEAAIRLCNYVDVYKNERITDQIEFMRATASEEETERFRLSSGDVLITKDSELWNDIGVPALVEYTAPDLICGYHLALLRPRNALLDGRYLFRAMQSVAVAYQLHVEANGVTRYGLSHAAIKSVRLPVPPLPEQASIAQYLDEATARFAAAGDQARREISLLREYRTRLIADVVTGKLDVREAVASLPNGADRDEDLEEEGVLNEDSEAADGAVHEASLEEVET